MKITYHATQSAWRANWGRVLSRQEEHRSVPGCNARRAVLVLLAQVIVFSIPNGALGQSRDSLVSDLSAAVMPNGMPEVVAAGLTIPWSAAVAGEEVLISQRGTGDIVAIRPGYPARSVGNVHGVVARGDGGMLGLAILVTSTDRWLYAYHGTVTGNRIVRMRYLNGKLGSVEIVLDGLPGGVGHNGGRLAFGPDGMLYATTGETRNPALSQDRNSLAGKILRMTPQGKIPPDNPIPSSYVYSLGHRNPQGLAWDKEGQLWATEFGEDTWDEMNRIVPGGNYGWPIVEGRAEQAGLIDPVLQWPTQEMGPSGLTFIDGTFFIAGLTGQRLWAVQVDDVGAVKAVDFFAGEFGRIRDVFEGADGRLWFLTNGRRGDPSSFLMSVSVKAIVSPPCILDPARTSDCASILPTR